MKGIASAKKKEPTCSCCDPSDKEELWFECSQDLAKTLLLGADEFSDEASSSSGFAQRYEIFVREDCHDQLKLIRQERI